jgi:hypothetical protein
VQVAEARALQRTVRECYPLLLQSEGVDHSAVSVSYYLRHLLLLRTSSLLGQFQKSVEQSHFYMWSPAFSILQAMSRLFADILQTLGLEYVMTTLDG